MTAAHEPGSGDAPSETVPEPGTTANEYAPDQIAAADQTLAEANDFLDRLVQDARDGVVASGEPLPIVVTLMAGELATRSMEGFLPEVCQALALAVYQMATAG